MEAQNSTRTPRVVIAGTHSGCGKTTVSIALMATFTRMETLVQPFKVGPDYIDPSFHCFVTKNTSYNLDSYLLNDDQIRFLFSRHASDFSLSIIEGVMGLYDGVSGSTQGSTAHIAQIIQAPTLLVVNGQGMSLSASALISGYAQFIPNYTIDGIILNNLSGDSHYSLLSRSIEEHTGISCYGYLGRHNDIELQRRHLGLIPSYEVADLELQVTRLATYATQTLDIEGIRSLANKAVPLNKQPPSFFDVSVQNSHSSVKKTFFLHPSQEYSPTDSSDETATKPPLRIGVCRDNAFSFYYQDNLELLISYGVELVPISPLTDAFLPQNIQGLYIGGGFPEVFAKELSQNSSFKSSLLVALDKGLPAYAECGGLMYLMETIIDSKGTSYPMVGFFTGSAVMTKKLSAFGYAIVKTCKDSILGPCGTTTKAHVFHHSKLEHDNGKILCDPVATVTKTNGLSWGEGFSKKNTLAWYPHLHFYSAPKIAKNFVQTCLDYLNNHNNFS